MTGTINNFKGNAVGSGWSVELKETSLLGSYPRNMNQFGPTRGSGAQQDGFWYARAGDGPSTQRPNSVTGSFRAYFSNGRAVGGYATVKDD